MRRTSYAIIAKTNLIDFTTGTFLLFGHANRAKMNAVSQNPESVLAG